MIYAEKKNRNDNLSSGLAVGGIAAGGFVGGAVGELLSEAARLMGKDFYIINIITIDSDYPKPIAISKTENEAANIIRTLAYYCPNAKMGYSSENKKYVKEVRKMSH